MTNTEIINKLGFGIVYSMLFCMVCVFGIIAVNYFTIYFLCVVAMAAKMNFWCRVLELATLER